MVEGDILQVITTAIEAHTSGRSPFDDITLLILKRLPDDGHGAPHEKP